MTKEEAIEKKGLMAEEYDEIVANFDAIDTDKSGFLDFKEIVQMVMLESGVSEEEAGAHAMAQMAMMDKDGDEKITFNEYIEALC